MPSPKSYQAVAASKTVEGFTAKALVGTHSTIVGWSCDKSDVSKDLLGFALRRTDFDAKSGTELQSKWLESKKRFRGIKEDVKLVGSDESPFQRFRWNDYTLKPEVHHRYEIFPMRGKPGDLKKGKPMVVDVVPSAPKVDDIGVYFNRGVTSAHAYLERFKGQKPEDVANNEAYDWLSRGLKESLLDFIAATKAGQALHMCIYEFFDAEIAEALQAVKAKVDVKIVVHAKSGDEATDKSADNVRAHKLVSNSVSRTKTGNISHNKFIVRLVGGRAKSVWTGSANFSENAFYFQTNNALVLDIPEIASAYEDYFQVLHDDPALGRKKAGQIFAQDRVEAINAAFKSQKQFRRILFSPVRNVDLLDLTADIITNAKSCVFISAPFALESTLVPSLLENNKDILEYGLVNATAKKKIEGLAAKHMRMIVPSRLETFMGKKWDAKAFGGHKIHSKLVIADPWSKNPRVLVGSSNHSDESCNKNDENNLLVEGDPRMAAIMATEFMRMFDHYNSRSFINNRAAGTKDLDFYNKEDSSWSATAFSKTAESHKFRDRIVFSGG
jgi:phosphatidylserine/phosphatidylglycerophosphate/cardiolipin synthase-like enzyme